MDDIKPYHGHDQTEQETAVGNEMSQPLTEDISVSDEYTDEYGEHNDESLVQAPQPNIFSGHEETNMNDEETPPANEGGPDSYESTVNDAEDAVSTMLRRSSRVSKPNSKYADFVT